ncbi:MAG: thiamine phosphate synthase [Oscillospiraceae bacterium]|nr:thiamine phosphate synthase [Oscillospiraceae bacterium]
MNCDKNTMLLYAVTDRRWTGGRTLYEDVEKALSGGVTALQLREKDLPYDDFLKEAREISALCKRYGVPFIINDNVEIAYAVKADGIHVGQSDMECRKVREALGEQVILGVSAGTREQAIAAVNAGADYLGVGAVFQTGTKNDADFVSFDALKSITSAVSVPVCAIGGITADNMVKLQGSGIDGVALVSAIFAADEITKTCQELLNTSKRLFSK